MPGDRTQEFLDEQEAMTLLKERYNKGKYKEFGIEKIDFDEINTQEKYNNLFYLLCEFGAGPELGKKFLEELANNPETAAKHGITEINHEVLVNRIEQYNLSKKAEGVYLFLKGVREGSVNPEDAGLIVSNGEKLGDYLIRILYKKISF